LVFIALFLGFKRCQVNLCLVPINLNDVLSLVRAEPSTIWEITHLSPSSGDTFVADWAWLGGPRLTRNVTIDTSDGLFTRVSVDIDAANAPRLPGVVLPGLVNAHSHAFHRLLRGRTHALGGDFWLWRERMYEAAESLTPESYEAVATAVFAEMAMAGVTTVGEFHYVHHQMGGVPYSDPNEMGHALVRAARRVGFRISLLEAGYFTAGFDEGPLHPVQTRFADENPETWLDRAEEMNSTYRDADDVVVGLAPHSVRAVPQDGLAAVANRRQPGTPVHIHLSEQPAENEECLRTTGLTPTSLADRVGLLGPDTTLVHATHLSTDDIETIGASKSTVCYCATTERDLADGIGPADELFAAGAALSVGTDSHAIIDLFEEARGIELHARLATRRRGVFGPHHLLTAASVGGATSVGFPGQGISAGSPADFVVVEVDSPRLAGMDAETGLDHLVFAATASDVTDVYVGGQRIVTDGTHPVWVETKSSLGE
jgi:formiminoglutamate deiminase